MTAAVSVCQKDNKRTREYIALCLSVVRCLAMSLMCWRLRNFISVFATSVKNVTNAITKWEMDGKYTEYRHSVGDGELTLYLR